MWIDFDVKIRIFVNDKQTRWSNIHSLKNNWKTFDKPLTYDRNLCILDNVVAAMSCWLLETAGFSPERQEMFWKKFLTLKWQFVKIIKLLAYGE